MARKTEARKAKQPRRFNPPQAKNRPANSAPGHPYRHTLALCMIVRNEVRCLERCLRGARPWVEQIVIVDTGSTDGTQAIARRYADVFKEIEWPDSFAAARNASIELSTCDYNIALDADEWMTPEHWDWARRIVDEHRPALMTFRLNEQPLGLQPGIMPRLFVNHPSVRYERVIHEVPEAGAYAKETGAPYCHLPGPVINHDGNSDPARLAAKTRARLPLLQRQHRAAAGTPEEAIYAFRLLTAYMVLERYADAYEVSRSIRLQELRPDNRIHARRLGEFARQKIAEQGTPARPFLFPAAEQVRPKVAGRVSAELQKAVR